MVLLRLIAVLSVLSQLYLHRTSSAESPKCSNLWAVEVRGGLPIAKRIAATHGFDYVSKILSDVHLLRQKGVSVVTYGSPCFNSSLHKALSMEQDVVWFEQQVLKSYKLYAPFSKEKFNDPKWVDQWYINGKQQPSHNVLAVWDQQITGQGIVVAVVDNGVDKTLSELKENFDVSASFDVFDYDTDPSPPPGKDHGNQCAGVIAAAANNSFCGVGIAYNSRIGGIRLTSQDATDAQEALGLSYKRNYIDIYSNSWGPAGLFGQVDGPRYLTSKALKEGAEKGRRGRGSIFVFAAGNGGIFSDSCAFNGYVNSIYTIAISGANKDGTIPDYVERCPGIIAVTYSGEYGNSDDVVTSNENGQCISTFSRTSAAAAMASGMIALLLQSNNSLGWRDVQHIIVRSARADKNALKSQDWKTNGAGFLVSNYYGFGLMDASKMVKYAKMWTSVPDQLKCEITRNDGPWTISATKPLKISFVLNDWNTYCGNGREIRYLEHVQVRMNLQFSKRSNLLMDLESPNGTVSQLIQHRPNDVGRDNLTDWTIITLHHWGEGAMGSWSLTLKNNDPRNDNKGTLFSWALILYGTNTDPLGGNPYVPAPLPIAPNTPQNFFSPTFNTDDDDDDDGLGTGAIAGIVIAVVVVVVVLCIGSYYWKRKKEREDIKRTIEEANKKETYSDMA